MFCAVYLILHTCRTYGSWCCEVLMQFINGARFRCRDGEDDSHHLHLAFQHVIWRAHYQESHDMLKDQHEWKHVYVFLLIMAIFSVCYLSDGRCRKALQAGSGCFLSREDDRRPIMPEQHIVNYLSLLQPSQLTTAPEINRSRVGSHLNQEGCLNVALCH